MVDVTDKEMNSPIVVFYSKHMILHRNFMGNLSFIPRGLTFKNSQTKWVGNLGYAVQRNPVLPVKVAMFNFVKEGVHPIQTHGAGWRSKRKARVRNKSQMVSRSYNDQITWVQHVECAFNHVTKVCLTHFQSIARPFGQPRVVFIMDKACDPSPHALIIFAGRYQSVQKIYLLRENRKHYAHISF